MKILLRTSILSLILLCVCTDNASVIAQEATAKPIPYEDPNYGKDKLSDASPALTKNFVKAVQESEFYKTIVEAALLNDVEKVVPEWNRLNPAGVKVHKELLIERLIRMDLKFSVGAEKWSLSVHSEEVKLNGDSANPSVYRDFIVLCMSRVSLQDPEMEDYFQYRIKLTELEPLNFDVINSVSIHHPLSRVLHKHEVSNQTLTDVVAGLCREADVDYAIRADLADKIRITQRLNDRSIFSCIAMAVETAGWATAIDATQYRARIFIDIEEIHATYMSRDYIKLMERLNKPIKTQFDALSYLVKTRIEQFKADGTVVVVSNPE